MKVYLVVEKARSPGDYRIEAVFSTEEAAKRWVYVKGGDLEVLELPVYTEPLDAHQGWES